jgi:TolB-like protein/DNA-binding winged helix-turn-helix (wHTH) protein
VHILGSTSGSPLATNATNSGTYCFGPFEYNPQGRELRRKGLRVRLEGQPLAVLAMLLEHPGELVTREALQKRLWPSDTFVDFEQSLNAAIRRLRLALDDSADSARYVETLPRRGYRWIAPLRESLAGAVVAPETPSLPVAVRNNASRRAAILLVGLAAIVLLASFVLRRAMRPPSGVAQGRLLITVTPLRNLSEEPGQDYFVQGLTEEIVTQLGQLNPRRIGVVQYRAPLHLPQAGSEVPDFGHGSGLQYLLEGSVRRQHQKARISVRLIRVADETTIWTESFDRNVGDVLSLQSAIAQRIGRELQIQVLGHASRQPLSSEAAEAYLRGRFELGQNQSAVPDAARAYFERTIALDPSYAPAYAGLADFYRARAVAEDKGSEQAWRLAEQNADKALALDSDSAEAHVAMARVKLMHDWDWPAAREHALRALQLNPSLPEAHSVYALYLRVAGDIPEDLNQRRQAVAVDPYREDLKEQLSFELYLARDFRVLDYSARQVLAADPNNLDAHLSLCINLGHLKLFNDAAAECGKELLLEGHADWAAEYLREFQDHGYQAASVAVARERLNDLLKNSSPDLWELANAYVAAGMRQEAMRALFRGLEVHEPGLLQIRVDPDFDSIREDPGYAQIIRRIAFPND